jgi:uncharacterized lipoprotein
MRTMHRARRAGLALVVLLLVLTSACSENPERADTESLSADGNDDTSTAETEEVPQQEDAEPPSEGGAEEAPPEDTAGQAQPPGEPLRSVTVPIGWVDGGELDMAVTELSVSGDLMRVAVTFTASLPDGTEAAAIGAVIASDETYPATGIFPEVIDPANLKAYEVVAGAIPNGTSINLEDGASRTLVFYFAAPQDPVDTVDVVISSQVPALTDVPFPQ